MKRKEIKELKQKNLAELGKMLDETRKKLMKLRMESRTEKIKNVRAVSSARDEIAQIMTTINQKKALEAKQ